MGYRMRVTDEYNEEYDKYDYQAYSQRDGGHCTCNVGWNWENGPCDYCTDPRCEECGNEECECEEEE